MRELRNEIKVKIKDALNLSANFAIENASAVNVYIHKKVMSDESHLKSMGFMKPFALQKEVGRNPQTLVLVDKKPLANWGHDCEYQMYNSDTGEYIETIKAQFPPASFITNNDDYEPVGNLVRYDPDPDEGKIRINSIPELNAISNATGKRYALLFSGMSNNRHLNDLEYLYRTLIHVHGLSDADSCSRI